MAKQIKSHRRRPLPFTAAQIDQKGDRLTRLLSERRWCYFIPSDGFIEGEGFRVSVVIENEPGHYLTGDSPEGGLRAPWYWGMTYTEAVENCRQMNEERLGLSAKDAALIVASSMGAG